MSNLQTNITSVIADQQLKAGAGWLESFTINNVTTGGVFTIYDSLTEAGTILFQTTLAISNVPIPIPLPGTFKIGLFISFDATLAGRVSVSWA